MFRLFILIALLVAVPAQAQQTDCIEKKHKKTKVYVAPAPKKVVPKKPTPVAVPIQKPAIAAPAAPKAEPCCKKDGNESTSSAGATTGNQVVNINMSPTKQEPKYRILVRTRVKRVTEKVEIYKPNRLLFLVGQSRTKC